VICTASICVRFLKDEVTNMSGEAHALIVNTLMCSRDVVGDSISLPGTILKKITFLGIASGIKTGSSTIIFSEASEMESLLT